MYYDLTQQLLILKHFLVKVKKTAIKRGKFKEDQIVIGRTEKMGYRYTTKYFKMLRSKLSYHLVKLQNLEVNRNYNGKGRVLIEN